MFSKGYHISGEATAVFRLKNMSIDHATLVLLLIGLSAGVVSGFFGIGGGVIIVPALIYLLGFSQHRAIGTSLAILLPPVGLGAAFEYYRHGNLDIRAAIFVAWACSRAAGSARRSPIRSAALICAWDLAFS
jgi:hypothetical protein